MLQFYLQLLDTEEEQRDFTLLYETYRKLMHWIAKRILYDEGLAEDAVQEAFLRIAKNFYKIKENHSFLSRVIPSVGVVWFTIPPISPRRYIGLHPVCRPLSIP